MTPDFNKMRTQSSQDRDSPFLAYQLTKGGFLIALDRNTKKKPSKHITETGVLLFSPVSFYIITPDKPIT